jgi:hypothetical protein
MEDFVLVVSISLSQLSLLKTDFDEQMAESTEGFLNCQKS